MNKIKSIIYTGGYMMLVRANITSAQGLVPCSGVDCNLCDLLVLVNNLITFMIEATIALAALFFAYGAFTMILAGGSPDNVNKGKESMFTAIKGVVVILTAWLILGTIIQMLSGSSSPLPWNEIKCTY
ncbi:hypothetical protein GW950_00590 [Candidatus Wolfebacteria bacterium]|nr:hypothetical protein [Candidatus Wolfebacteria bacterium]